MNGCRAQIEKFWDIAKEEGIEESKIETSINMYNLGIDIEDICKIVDAEKIKVQNWIENKTQQNSELERIVEENKKEIELIKTNPELEELYSDKLYELKQSIILLKGQKEEGKKECKKMIIFNMHKKGMNIKEICKMINMKEEIVKSVIMIEEKQALYELPKF